MLRCLTGELSLTSGAFAKHDRINSVGLCPQRNSMISDLSVRDHLLLYSQIRGCDRAEAVAEAQHLLEEIGLVEKSHTLSQELSGGQKRALCVAIAFTGCSSLVILDEPSSGMDAQSQRRLWDMIKVMSWQAI